jgi:hypothetical protein
MIFMLRRKFIVVLFLIGLFLPLSCARAGAVLSAYKYAWSNEVGYVNFEQVIVNDNALSGYAWSANAGWISFSPTQGGVLNDGTGNLSGSAWGTGLGYIDFDNVSIDPSTGKFSGTATGALIGTLTFDCSNCDVRTDWQPLPSHGSVAGSSIGSALTSTIPEHIDTHNEPLIILPAQSGTFEEDTPAGQVVLEVPANSVLDQTTFTITYEPLISTNNYFVVSNTELIEGAFYNITAKDQDGNFVHNFPNLITITLPIPPDLLGATDLGVYWLDEQNSQWVLIPDAVFTDGKVTFKVNHLTKFAIFRATDKIIKIPQEPTPSSPLPSGKTPTLTNQQNPKLIYNISWNSILPILILLLTTFLLLLKNRKR